jgi:hypothetical protein
VSTGYGLGIAVAKGIPAVLLVAAGAKPSPMFTQYVVYDPEMPAPRLAYLLAKQVEQVMTSVREPWDSPYREGERFVGVVTHVDLNGGYLLVVDPGRPGAILHASRMSPETRAALERLSVIPGWAVVAQVVGFDRERRSVLLRELPADQIATAREHVLLRVVASLMRSWRTLSLMLDTYEVVAPPERLKDVRAFIANMQGDIARIRAVRNAVAHGEQVNEETLRLAEESARAIVASLKPYVPSWAGWGSNPQPTA